MLMEALNDTHMKRFKVPDNRLSLAQVHFLAGRVSAALCLPVVPLSAVKQSRGTPLPVHAENANGRIWVDRYYIAYMLHDGLVRYVYLSHRYIQEERIGCKGCPDLLTKEMLRDFRVALRKMNQAGAQTYIFADRLHKLEQRRLQHAGY